MNNYIVATIKPWNINAYLKHVSSLDGQWFIVDNPEDLVKAVENLNPRYIFFPHWSWKVPEKIVERYECVCFHMTDVPYGRGGSPLQNLIMRGHLKTKLTALKMIDDIDAGPVYMKVDLSLAGSAQKIYERMADEVYEMIRHIINLEPEPEPQHGEVTGFDRRTPEQSVIPENATLASMYDHIRMLDADTYPHAFIEYGEFKFELTGAEIEDDTLKCNVRIKHLQNEQ